MLILPQKAYNPLGYRSHRNHAAVNNDDGLCDVKQAPDKYWQGGRKPSKEALSGSLGAGMSLGTGL